MRNTRGWNVELEMNAEFEKQLRGLISREDPGAGFTEKVLALMKARMTNRPRAGRRLIVIGVAAIALAAAAMLGVYLWNPEPGASAAVMPTLAPGSNESVEAIVAAESPAPVVTEQKDHEMRIEAVEEAATPFVVLVLPLQNNVTDSVGNRALDSMYAAFLKLLREIPGVTLLEQDPTIGTPGSKPDFRITIQNMTPTINGKFLYSSLQVDKLRPDGTVRGTFAGTSTIEVAPVCETTLANALKYGAARCEDAVGTAASMLDLLRKTVFPPEPGLRRQMQARLLDRSLDSLQRLQALTDLWQFGRFAPGANTRTAVTPLRDPVDIRGAVDLATTAIDPSVRAGAWDTLRGAKNKDLIPSLLATLGKDADSDVRIAALGVMAGDFNDDPSVRAALKAAAEKDSRPLVRALARRATDGIPGAVAWENYISASLQDPGLSAVERIEALFYQMDLPSTQKYLSNIHPLGHAPDPERVLQSLDKEALKALFETMPRAVAESSIVKESAIFLVTTLGIIDDPAITDMLLANLSSGRPWPFRDAAVEALGRLPTRRNDPRVRAVFEGLGMNGMIFPGPPLKTGDLRVVLNTSPDSTTRSASWREQSPEPSINLNPVQDGKPRLGVNTSLVESGPYVPQELVGKVVVVRVIPESVAQKAGLKEEDVLVEINGVKILSVNDMTNAVGNSPRAVEVDVVVLRSGETVKLKAAF